MIKVTANSNNDDVNVTTNMEGVAIDLMAEGVSIVESLCDDFRKHDLGTEFLFLVASSVGRMIRDHEDKDGENLA